MTRLIPKLSPADEADFHSYVDYTSTPDGCWLWTGPTFEDQLGKKTSPGKGKYGEWRGHHAHRVAKQIDGGQIPIPVNQQVMRSCGNTLCCRPDHAYLKSDR